MSTILNNPVPAATTLPPSLYSTLNNWQCMSGTFSASSPLEHSLTSCSRRLSPRPFSFSCYTRCCLVIKSNGCFSIFWHQLTLKITLFLEFSYFFFLNLTFFHLSASFLFYLFLQLAFLHLTPKFASGSVFNSLFFFYLFSRYGQSHHIKRLQLPPQH